MLLCWAFLEWRFTGAAFANVWRDTNVLRFGVSVDSALSDAISLLVLAPVFAATVAIVGRRRLRAAATMTIPVIGIALASWFGLALSEASGIVLLSVVALYSIPRRRLLAENILLGVAGLAQIVATTVIAIDAERVEPFLDALL